MTTDSDTRVWPDVAIAPGEGLAEELEAREISVHEFARLLGMSEVALAAVLEGKASITASLALQLEKELEIPATFWMNLQTDYDLTLARIKRAETTALPH